MHQAEFAARILEMQQTLYRVSYSFLSQETDREDAVQECICKAWTKCRMLRDDNLFQTWVVRILINECHNIGRSRKRVTAIDEFPDRAAPPDGNEALHDAILALSEALRMPLVLHYIEGYDVSEISAILRIPAGTVKSRLFRARSRMKELLTEEAQGNG